MEDGPLNNSASTCATGEQTQGGGEGSQAGGERSQAGGGAVSVEEWESEESSSGCGLEVGNYLGVFSMNVVEMIKDPSALMGLQ